MPIKRFVIHKDPSARGGRSAASWAALIATLIGAAIAVGFAYAQQAEADRERKAVDAASRLITRLAEVDAAEWRAIAQAESGSVQSLRGARLRFAVSHGPFHEAGVQPETFDEAFISYLAALDDEIDLLEEDRLEQAVALHEELVDPSYDAVRGAAAEAVSARTEAADSASAAAGRLTWVAAALGALTLFLLFVLLVAQQRLLARERRHLEELHDLDRLKDDFVASVSHELRTPLTSIRGYLELVLAGEAGELTEEQRDFLGVVDRNSNRLLHLVSDLLDVAQIESGRLSLDLEEEELADFLAATVDAARPLASGHGVELALHRNGEARARVDRTRLEQVIDNLLSNALKFTQAGGRVDVRLTSSNGAALVEIADTSFGMSPADQEKLFQRFYRAAPVAEQAIPGSGLGLWISKAIVEAHGGSITVESAAGRGSTFRVRLPTAAARA